MLQGEIWQINLNPTIGSEMKKVRPCVILNSNKIGKLPLKVIAPITDFKPHYTKVPWMVILNPDNINNLNKKSVIDLFQVRSVSQERLIKKIGEVDKNTLLKCKMAIELVFEISI